MDDLLTSIPLGRCVLCQVLPIALNNRNAGQGRAWYDTNKERREIEQVLRLEGCHHAEPMPSPCKVRLTRMLGKGEREWDFDSIGRGNAKQLLDSLVALGWFVDDGPKHIAGVFYDQDSSCRDIGPATRIEVFEV